MKKLKFGSGSVYLADLAIYIILGLTPLFFNYFYPTSVDLSKITLFKTFILLLLFAVAWRYSKFKIKFNTKIAKDLIPLGILFIFLSISLFASVDISKSWFGSYDRQEGLISWLFYGLWAFLLILHLNGDHKLIKINNFLKAASISGLLVSIYAVLQIFAYDFISWSEPASVTGRAVSSFGQPNYLACWLVLILPFSAYLVYITKHKISRLLWSLVFLTELAALFSTGSRSVFLVFLGVSIVFSLWFLWQKNILSRRNFLLIAVTSGIILISFLSFLAFSNKTRFNEFKNVKTGSAAFRMELWRGAWQSYLQKPWLGYGLENQSEAYVSRYKIDWALYARPNTYSDRAHNLILDILLTSGLLGVLVFIYFIYWVYTNLFKALKNEKYSNLAAFLILSLLIYLISLLFNFSVTVTNIYFWLIVALSFSLSDKTIIISRTDKKNSSLFRIILVSAFAIIFFYGALIEIKKLEADYYYNKALVEITKSEYFTALVLDDCLLSTHPYPVFLAYYNQSLSLRFLEKLPTIKDKSSAFVVLKYLSTAQKTLMVPNFDNKFVKAFIFGALGNRVESDKIFSSLANLSPELPEIHLAWGDSLMFNHDYKNAMIKFKEAYRLLPDSNNQYLNTDQKNHLDLYKQQIENRLTNVKILAK